MELDRLFGLIRAQDVAGVRAWPEVMQRRQRAHARHVVMLLADFAAARRRESAGDPPYRLELGEDASPESVMCGRVVTAAMNQDDAMTRSLVTALMQWNSGPRTRVLWELVEQLHDHG